jgi:O-phosphoseryl-tRNA(Sec) kinase
LEQCLKWNRQRATNIDDEVILRIYQKFDIPGKKYKWDVPLMEIDYSKPQKIIR